MPYSQLTHHFLRLSHTSSHPLSECFLFSSCLLNALLQNSSVCSGWSAITGLSKHHPPCVMFLKPHLFEGRDCIAVTSQPYVTPSGLFVGTITVDTDQQTCFLIKNQNMEILLFTIRDLLVQSVKLYLPSTMTSLDGSAISPGGPGSPLSPFSPGSPLSPSSPVEDIMQNSSKFAFINSIHFPLLLIP